MNQVTERRRFPVGDSLLYPQTITISPSASQSEAPYLNDLLQGKLDKFSLDALVNLAATAGLVLEMKVAATV